THAGGWWWATDARTLPGPVAWIASRDAGPAFLAGIAGEHNRLTVHSRLIHIVPRCPPVITSLSDIRLVRSCLLDGITRGARGTAARWRRRPLPSSHRTGCPREVTSSRPGRRTEPAARATGATTVFPRGTWWT